MKRKIQNKLSISILVLVALHCLALGSLAEYIHPGEVSVTTVRYKPEANSLLPGTYHYSVEWEGIPVARAQIEVKDADVPQKEDLVAVAADTKTSGIVKAFYNLKHRSESVFRKDDFQPIQFTSYQKENSRRKYREVVFADDGTVTSERWKKGRPKTVVKFASENAVFDPISAAFLAKSLTLEEGKQVSFDVFNGKHRYLITFLVGEKERIKVNGVKRLAYNVKPSVTKLTDSEGEKKLRGATLWISADGDREILKLESEVWIGSVTAEFERFDKATKSLKTARASTPSLKLAKRIAK